MPDIILMIVTKENNKTTELIEYFKPISTIYLRATHEGAKMIKVIHITY